MATAVVMPKLSFVVTEGTILEWLKEPGDEVEKGEPLLVIESEKATVDVESPGTGTLGSELAPVGTTVPVTTIIGYILAPGESSPELRPFHEDVSSDATGQDEASAQPGREAAPSGPVEDISQRRIKASPSAKRVAREHSVDLARVEGSGPDGRVVQEDVLDYLENAKEQKSLIDKDVHATPVARNLAVHLGVDLARVEGSGPKGRVTSEDVRGAAEGASQISQRAEAQDADHELTTVQRITAERMTLSFRETPHFYLSVQVDMTQSIGVREQLLPVIESRIDVRLSFSDILILAVSRGLREYPSLNASYKDGRPKRHRQVNVGLAVDTPRGLMVPVIHNADRLSLEGIAGRRADLVKKARENRLSIDELADGTFTVSNLGMFGIDVFSAIINPPEAAILAVGRIREQPVAVAGQLEIRPTMWLTLSVDHRATDGATGGRFLQTLGSYLESPHLLLV